MPFGERLLAMRKQRNLTLRQLATRAGMDYSLLSKIENGLRPDPDVAVLFALIDALHELGPVSEEEFDALLSEAQRMTPERQERLRRSPSLQLFMRRKPR